jgi:hypothetical protein
MINLSQSGQLLTTAIGTIKKKIVIDRCGNVAAILELDENVGKFYKKFEAAPNV